MSHYAGLRASLKEEADDERLYGIVLNRVIRTTLLCLRINRMSRSIGADLLIREIPAQSGSGWDELWQKLRNCLDDNEPNALHGSSSTRYKAWFSQFNPAEVDRL